MEIGFKKGTAKTTKTSEVKKLDGAILYTWTWWQKETNVEGETTIWEATF